MLTKETNGSVGTLSGKQNPNMDLKPHNWVHLKVSVNVAENKTFHYNSQTSLRGMLS